MIGSGSGRPPFPVTLDNWQSAGQLDWTFQHMAEIFPTIPISRGPAPAPSLPRHRVTTRTACSVRQPRRRDRPTSTR